MFPSSGFFRGVNCPYFASGLCDRPYCHFRHAKPPEEKIIKESPKGSTTSSGPSYSFNSSQISGFSALPSNSPDFLNSYSKKESSSLIGNNDKTQDVTNESALCSIPSFSEAVTVLPESLPEPKIDRLALPKISGLAKRKLSTPSYNPTPRELAACSISSQPTTVDNIPSYHPTPISSVNGSISRSKKATIEYDPVRNYAVNPATNEHSDEENATDGAQLNGEAEFSDDGNGEEEQVQDNADNGEKEESDTLDNDQRVYSGGFPLPSYADLLTPSSYFTNKLSCLSSGVSTKGSEKSSTILHDNGKDSDTDKQKSSKSSVKESKTLTLTSRPADKDSSKSSKSSNNLHKSPSRNDHHVEDSENFDSSKKDSKSHEKSSESSKKVSRSHLTNSQDSRVSKSSSKSSSKESKSSSSHQDNADSKKSFKPSSKDSKSTSVVQEKTHSSKSKSSKQSTDVNSRSHNSSSHSSNRSSSSKSNSLSSSSKSLSSSSPSSSSLSSSSSHNKKKTSSSEVKSSSSKSSKDKSSSSKSSTHLKSHKTSSSKLPSSNNVLSHSSSSKSPESSKFSVKTNDHKSHDKSSNSDSKSDKSKSKHSNSNRQLINSSLDIEEADLNSDSSKSSSSKYSSSHSNSKDLEKKSFEHCEKENSHKKLESHSVKSTHAKELKRSSSVLCAKKLKTDESHCKSISRSISLAGDTERHHSRGIKVKERQSSLDIKTESTVKEEKSKDKKNHSVLKKERDMNDKSSNGKSDHRSHLHIKAEGKKSSSNKSSTSSNSNGVNADLFGEDSDGSDSDVQIIEPPPQPAPEVLELTDSEEDDNSFSGLSLLRDEDFNFSDDDTFDECLRIFQETDRKLKISAQQASSQKSNDYEINHKSNSKKPEVETVPGKIRMAHPSAKQVVRPFKPTSSKAHLSPAEVMHNRIIEMQKRALLRAAQREGRESDLPGNVKSLSQLSSTSAKSTAGNKRLSSDESASHVVASQKRREAHQPSTPAKATTDSQVKNSVWSPNSFYTKKKPPPTDVAKRLSGSSCGSQSKPQSVTIASTASKTEKRKAHTPTSVNLKRPLVASGDSSKVPINVRQRYLDRIIDEFLKFCFEEEAFDKALEEEETVYARANNKNIYLRLVVNAIARIRAQAAESQPSSSKKAKMDSLSALASLGSSAVSQSHEATLGGSRAAKTSFTMNRSSASRISGPVCFKGAELYQRLQKHVMTEEQLRENNYPRPSEEGSGKVKYYDVKVEDSLLKDNERNCRRCGKRYSVAEDGTCLTQQECVYHYANAYKKKVAGAIVSVYGCCNERAGSEGCQVASFHVNEKNKYVDLAGYMKTLPAEEGDHRNTKVLSLDCEMVYTKAGLQLARVTVVGDENQVVYETLVRPDSEIIDYNTRFSGITAPNMKGVTTTLRGVQAVMLSMVSDKTILIGHSLESDLMALKMIHSTVVDTAIVFPHRLGLPYKRALRNLMMEHLQKVIQADDGGHDSKEDAVSCMQLMLYKVKQEAKSENRRS